MKRPSTLFAALVVAALAPATSALASPVVVVDGARHTVVDDPTLPATHDLPAPPAAGCETPVRSAAAPRSARGSATRGPTVPRALRIALRKRAITQEEHDHYRAVYSGARSAKRALSGRRSLELGSVIATLERIAREKQLFSSRMPALFLQLRRNTEFWRAQDFPSAPPSAAPEPCQRPSSGVGGARVTFPGSAMVFQYYPGNGLQLQPLANFGKANGLYNACVKPSGTVPCKMDELRALLDEMLETASRRGNFTAWEYFFQFGGGTPPWASGLAQGTGIQALARAAKLLDEPRYLKAARSAVGLFEARTPLGVRLPLKGGNHYLIYSFDPGLQVLNGFLQALNGLHDYAKLSGDARALALFRSGDRRARIEVPMFDTGAWSLYARRGRESSLDYHRLVRDFMNGLCDRTKASTYCETTERFSRYLREPPRVTFVGATGVKVRKPAKLRLLLSKVSCVTVTIRDEVGAQVFSTRIKLPYGNRFFSWTPSKKGDYSVTLNALDPRRNEGATAGVVRVR